MSRKKNFLESASQSNTLKKNCIRRVKATRNTK